MSVLSELVPLASAAIGGGAISAIAVKWMDLRSAERKDDGERLKDCQEKYDELVEKFEQVSLRLRAVEASTPAYLARWIKGQDKRLIWLNDRAYMTIFAPLGWSRQDVIGKTFGDLLGDGNREALDLLDEIDRAALKHPNEPQSLVLQLHPDLPNMVIIKVAVVGGDDGLLRYEGSSFVPTTLGQDIGKIREHRARTAAAMMLFNEKTGEAGHV